MHGRDSDRAEHPPAADERDLVGGDQRTDIGGHVRQSDDRRAGPQRVEPRERGATAEHEHRGGDVEHGERQGGQRQPPPAGRHGVERR